MPKRFVQQQTSSNQLKSLTLKVCIPKHACSCLPDIDIFKLVTLIKNTPKQPNLCKILFHREEDTKYKRNEDNVPL